jgi:phospholipid/cholesterol/gamma-HCH transport system substrate-binding protein
LALNKDIKVAALAILSIVIFVIAYLFMRGTLFQSGDPVYTAIFTDVEGVKKSDKVYLNGVAVGSVTLIEFKDINRPTEIALSFTVDKTLRIPHDTKIEVISTSLMGNMGLKLILGKSTQTIKSDEYLLGLPENGLMAQLSDKVSPLAESSDALVKNVNTMFDRNQQENLYVTIAELNKTIANANSMLTNMNQMVNTNQKPLHQTMVNFEKMSASLASKSEDVSVTIRNIREITDKTNQGDISGMMKKLDKSMAELNGTLYEINNGNGTLTKLLKDPVLYNNLSATVMNTNELMIDFKTNPKRYVGFSIFGKK